MKSVGIREAKAQLSALARAETTVLTDYGKPIAVIAPLAPPPEERGSSDGSKFRQALLAIPNGLHTLVTNHGGPVAVVEKRGANDRSHASDPSVPYPH